MSGKSAASIRARLKKRADELKQDFNLVLTRFGLERLLYRLSVSKYSGSYLLKGALLFSIWYGEVRRPTRDADLLGFGTGDVATAVSAFQEVCGIDVQDGIQFEAQSVKGDEIRTGDGYGGVRLHLIASLDGARITLQIDIGFGDAVIPGPEQISYPVLLDDLPAPALRAYPKYSVIAEKLHAVCLLGMANSRMKDYFDLHVLLKEEALDTSLLTTAVRATFERRRTELPQTVPVGLSRDFCAEDSKRKQWSAFLRKAKLDAPSLEEVVNLIRDEMFKRGLLKN